MTLFICLVLLIALVFLLYVGVRDGNRFVVREYTVYSQKITRKKTFVFLSDMHAQTYGKTGDVDGPNGPVLRAVERVHPDAVLIGGDMIISKDASADKKGWMEPATELLYELCKKYPVYQAEGNHEAQLAADKNEGKFIAQLTRYEQACQEAGTIRLHNKSTEDFLEASIRIYGLDLDPETYRKIVGVHVSEEMVESKIGKRDPNVFTLLLAHNPDNFPAYAAWGADLVLSGHIHGGIMRIGRRGVLSPKFTLFPRYTGGEYTLGSSKMILSCGIGTHTMHLRFFNPAELTVVHGMPCSKQEEG